MATAPASELPPPPELYDSEDSTNTCLLCDDPEYELHREITHFGFPFRFSRCSCGIIKQTPMPNEQFFEWFFNSEIFFSAKETGSHEIWGFYDYFRDEGCRLATSRYRYWRLRSIFRRDEGLEIMKIGPSTGTMLHVANEHGHHAIGCDVSDRFVRFAEQTYGVRIDHGRFERRDYRSEQFDVILLFNVIENVPNLAEFLDSVNDRLKPGGYFVLNHVPMEGNLIERMQGDRYFMYRPPICYMFGTDVLKRLLRNHGFETVEAIRDVRIVNLEKILSLLGWNTLLRVARSIRLHRIPFPVYAYPSRILVTRK